jgi:hypothetical protein
VLAELATTVFYDVECMWSKLPPQPAKKPTPEVSGNGAVKVVWDLKIPNYPTKNKVN